LRHFFAGAGFQDGYIFAVGFFSSAVFRLSGHCFFDALPPQTHAERLCRLSPAAGWIYPFLDFREMIAGSLKPLASFIIAVISWGGYTGVILLMAIEAPASPFRRKS